MWFALQFLRKNFHFLEDSRFFPDDSAFRFLGTDRLSAVSVSRSIYDLLPDSLNLPDTRDVTAALEFRLQPGMDNIEDLGLRNQPGAKGNDIGIIMLGGQTRAFPVPAQGAPYTLDLVGDHGFSVAAAPKHNAHIILVPSDTFGGRPYIIGVVHRCITVGAEIMDKIARPLQIPLDSLLGLETRVIRCYSDSFILHCRFLP
jgi:hypothetical protein